MKNLYTLFNFATLFLVHRREYFLLKFLKKHNFVNLKDKKILEVGCGTCFELRNFLRYGSISKNLYGIDINLSSIFNAKNINGEINLICANAKNLPFKEKSFDIIAQFTCFSSILFKKDRIESAREIQRCIKSDGIIFWYDFYIKKPSSKNIVAIKKKEIKELFEGCILKFNRITLAPPIVRITFISHIFSLFLENLKILNTHYLVVIKAKK